MLNQALASELLCLLRYRHHQIAAKGIDFPQVAAEFKEHAESEESHALMIAARISQLGGTADFNPAYIAERIAIEVYRKHIQWFGSDDPTTRRMLEDILADEEDHADDMAGLLTKVDRKRSDLK